MGKLPKGMRGGQDFGDLSASARKFFESSQFADLTIKADDREYKVHKLVVCAHSEYFYRLSQNNWKEVDENEITLKEDDPLALHAMIRFMYGYDYDSSSDGCCSPMLFNIKVYQVADKYGVPKLKQKVKKTFETIVQTCWSMDDFPIAIEQVYDTTPEGDRGLRDPIVETAHEHIDELLGNDSFNRVFKERADFAENLARCLIRKMRAIPPPHIDEYRCPHCNKQWNWGSGDEAYPQRCPQCGHCRSDWNAFVVE